MQPPMTSIEDINDPIEAMNADRKIQNVGGNGENQFGQYAGQVTQNQQGYNAWQNGGIQVAQNAVENAGVQSGGNQNGLIVVPGIANQNGTGNVVATRAEGTGNGNQARLSCSLIKRKNQGFNFKQNNLTSGCCRKINALHLSSAKQITTLNDEISNLNKQISKEKSTISSFMEEKKKLKHDFKTQEDNFLDKEVDLEAKIKDLENILFKRDQTIQTMHMLNPKPNSFYHPAQKTALGYLNPSYLKKAQLKQQSLYNDNLLLEEHDPLVVVQNFEIQFLQEAAKFVQDFKSLAKEADESLDKQKSLELEIERILKASVSHDIMSIVQNGFVDVPSDLQTELNRTKEKLKLCIIKKEKEYAFRWNNWYTKCEE
nr:hypothetical protein [Tanacetum cinerariifolium]